MLDDLPKFLREKISANRECWLWTAAKDKLGYGRVHIPKTRRATAAYRLVYETLIGPIPPGLELDHLCRVTSCVRPLHLEAVTHAENVRRGRAPRIQAAKWATPRSCPGGHEMSGDNLYTYYNKLTRRTNRQCRTCKRELKRIRRIDGTKN